MDGIGACHDVRVLVHFISPQTIRMNQVRFTILHHEWLERKIPSKKSQFTLNVICTFNSKRGLQCQFTIMYSIHCNVYRLNYLDLKDTFNSPKIPITVNFGVGIDWNSNRNRWSSRKFPIPAFVLLKGKTWESIPERFRPLPGRLNVARGAQKFGRLGWVALESPTASGMENWLTSVIIIGPQIGMAPFWFKALSVFPDCT